MNLCRALSITSVFVVAAIASIARGDDLYNSLSRSDLEKVKAAIAADPKAVNTLLSGTPPLHISVWGDKLELVKFLLASGADVKATDNSNLETALHAAVSRGRSKEIVEAILAAGADVNAKSRDGSTPLHIAVSRYNKPMVELLLASKADVHAVENRGKWTPLHMAVVSRPSVITHTGNLAAAKANIENTFKEIAELLIASKADINAKNGDGKTALQFAQERKLPVMVEALQKAGAK